MESIPLLDRAGRRRSPATTSSFHRGVPPRNKGLRYPPDPPTVEEIIAVMRAVGDGPDGVRLRGVIVVLWRAGLRISEALALNETDLAATAARCSSATARAISAARSEWTAGRGRSWGRGWSCAEPCRSDDCSASYADRHAAGRAHRPASANRSTMPRSQPGSGAGSRHISCGTPMR